MENEKKEIAEPQYSKELSTWRNFSIGMCISCILMLLVIAFVVMQNDELKIQIKIYRNATENISNNLLAIGAEYDRLVEYNSNITECYWQENELSHRLARCRIDATEILGGGCGKLVYKKEKKDMLLYCEIEGKDIECYGGEVEWINRYGWKDGIDFTWINDKKEWCSRPEEIVIIRSF